MTCTLQAGVEGIMPSAPMLYVQPTGNTARRRLLDGNKKSFVAVLLNEVAAVLDEESIVAIGHRIVHGGPRYSQPQAITESLERELDELAAFDPEHMPLALELITATKKRFAGAQQVACFDTAFFHNLPRVAQLLPLPRKYQEKGLRRYGFHGLSYQYLQGAFRDLAGDGAVNGRVIYAHLGSGASLAATRGGQPIDTTMSMTPASGIVMSSRAGDLDPCIGWYLEQQEGISAKRYNQMVNHESGLLGVSGVSADMATLLLHERESEQVAEAIELFCYRARQAIGALSASLGGLDSLVFSGGIGEQSAAIRMRICEGLDFLGIQLDHAANEQHGSLISVPGTKVGVHVIPTDEARLIATQVAAQVQKERV
jgi:acetate kinase